MTTRAISDVLLLQDYNTAVVVIGTTMLGIAAGCAGTLMLLRKRALLGDVVAHATLPGVVGAFLVMQALGGTGKHLAGLLVGATITGLFAAWCVPVLRRAFGPLGRSCGLLPVWRRPHRAPQRGTGRLLRGSPGRRCAPREGEGRALARTAAGGRLARYGRRPPPR